MRKIVALVVALAVVFSSMSFAFAAAPSDIAGNKYESSILKLMSLGIINGYGTGADVTYKPGDNIKRCEFAKLMCVALGLNDAATGAKNTQVFNDVKTDHWAAGYVAVAYRQGIIKGVGAGNFDPEANVTYEQVVTMIVRALGKGYDKQSDVLGGYPVGYLSIASQQKITDNTDGVPGTPAKRDLVAKLLDNSLEVQWMGMGVAKIDSDGKVEYQFQPSTSTVDGKVVEDNILSKGLHLKNGTPEIKDYNTTNKTIEFTSDVDSKRIYKYVEPIDPTNTKHCMATVWVKDGVVYSFANDTTVKADMISKVNDSDASTVRANTDIDSVTLKVDGSLYNTNKDDKTSTYVNVLLNDSGVNSSSNLVNKFAKVYIKDSKVYRVEAFDAPWISYPSGSMSADGLISAVDATNGKINFQKWDSNDGVISCLNTATDLLYVFVDGAPKTLADLKADMVFKAWVSSDSKKAVIAARTTKVTGKLDQIGATKVTIGGASYDTVGDEAANKVNTGNNEKYASYNNGTDYNKDNLKDLSTLDVVAYKGLDDKICFIKGTATSSTSDFVALVKSFMLEGKSVTLVRDVNGVSTETNFTVKTDSDDLKVGSTTGKTTTEPGVLITWARFVADEGGTAGDVTSTTNPEMRVFKFTVDSDNKVTKIQRLSFNGVDITPTKFNKDTDVVENATRNVYVDGTVFFDLKDNKVVYWKDIEDKAVTSVNFQYSLKTNTFGEAVAFTNDTYKNIQGTDKFYAYVSGETYAAPYYNITSDSGDVLNLHKDDATDGITTAMDKQFISYVKDSDKVKVKSVTKVVYNSAYTKGITLADAKDEDNKTTLVWGKFVSRDGRTLTVDVEGGDIATGAGQTFIVDTASKTIKTAFNSSNNVDKDNTTVQNYTDLVGNDQVGLVIVDGLVKAIYFVR